MFLSHDGSVSDPLGSFTKHACHNSLDCNKIAKGYARTVELCVRYNVQANEGNQNKRNVTVVWETLRLQRKIETKA